jgi:hypothetical protein
LIKFIPLLFLTSVCQANNYQEAGQKALEAWYAQSETRNIIQYKLELYQEKLPKEYKKTLAIVIPLVDTLIKQRVEVTYEF